MSKSNDKSFLKSVLTLMTGTVIAQLISLIGLIYIQRYYYGPEEFANFKLFYEFAAIFVGVSALRLETGIVLEKEDSKAISLTNLSLKLVLITGIISATCLLVYSQFDKELAKFYDNKLLFILMPVAVVLLGFTQVFNSWFTRENSFKIMSTGKVVQNSSSVIGQLLFALTKLKTNGLIYGRLVGFFLINILFFWKYFGKAKKLNSEKGINKELIRKNNKFIYYTTPSVLLSGIVNFLLIDLFMKYYGEDFSGKIGSAYHYLGISIAVITTSFAQVYYSKISRIDSKEELKANYTYWFKRLFIVAGLGVLIIHLIPNTWDEIVLGNAWNGSIEIMKTMSIWMGIMFVSSSLSYIYIKLGRQKEMLLFDIFHIILIYLSIKFSHHQFNNNFVTLWWFTAAQSFYYLIIILITFRFINKFKVDTSN